jgi:hypothetical protein
MEKHIKIQFVVLDQTKKIQFVVIIDAKAILIQIIQTTSNFENHFYINISKHKLIPFNSLLTKLNSVKLNSSKINST